MSFKTKEQKELEFIITTKLSYSVSNTEKDTIYRFQKNYNTILKLTYNRLFENNDLTSKEIIQIQKSYNNIFIDSHFKNSAFYNAKAIIEKQKEDIKNSNDFNQELKPIIFGGKKLFLDRMNGKISKEEFQKQKLLPIYSVGEANQKGNRKFRILNSNEILFKPNEKTHIILNLNCAKNYKQQLDKLTQLQNEKKISITYSLSADYVYLTFDNQKLRENEDYLKIKDRIFAIDMNPNYIGYSVIDWKDSENFDLISSGVFSLKQLNDYDFSLKNKGFNPSSKERIYIQNKRIFEIINIANKLISLAKYYKCEIFSMEGLSIKSSDKCKGKKFNKLCNNLWCKNKFVNQIKKQCKFNKIECLEVKAEYSSFIGNLVYREIDRPDMILSSIELSRRAYEWFHQYVKKDKKQEKNIIFNETKAICSKIKKSLEELHLSEVSFVTIKDLYTYFKTQIKNFGQKYRVPLDRYFSTDSRVFSRLYNKNYQVLYTFV